MIVANLLTQKAPRIISVKPDDTIAAVVQVLGRERIGAVLVRDNAGIHGILSERDIVRSLAREGATLLDRKASDVMTSNVIFCRPEDTINHVMSLMTEGRFRHLPVKRGGEVVGVISIGDVVKARIEETEQEAQAMREYIATG